MRIVYQVLEDEFIDIRKSSKVEIVPNNYLDTLQGRNIEINPKVDENGFVEIVALIDNHDLNLIVGQNVRVFVKNIIPDQLQVPKNALVTRQNRQVVFTSNKGLAIWNYVKTGPENENSVIINNGILEGDSVIHEGNLLLANNTPIHILN